MNICDSRRQSYYNKKTSTLCVEKNWAGTNISIEINGLNSDWCIHTHNTINSIISYSYRPFFIHVLTLCRAMCRTAILPSLTAVYLCFNNCVCEHIGWGSQHSKETTLLFYTYFVIEHTKETAPSFVYRVKLN